MDSLAFRWRFAFIVLCLLISSIVVASPATEATSALLYRTIGDRARAFQLSDISPEAGKDVYIIEADHGSVHLSGSNSVAMARGAYEYIRDACKRQVAWGRPHVKLPDALPDYSTHRVVCPNKYRHYFNVCTFGYSTVWWDWKRWEEEIDWMALHGINMPLAMNGQEAIWLKVWQEFGVKESDILSYFSGPAFLTWHRMGNINSHGGPLRLSWIKQQAELQKRILARERELAMMPVTPAFSGFIPPAFRKAHPSALVTESSAWAGFTSTLLLNPQDPLYLKIGKRYVEAYNQEFGAGHLYLADVYNEMTPKLPPASKFTDLEATGKAVYDAITAGDSQGTWVMQGWLFYNDAGFWGKKETEAFLRGVPDDRMIIIDLACDSAEIWRAQPSVRKKQWIYCTLHNFGQTTTLFGDLREYAARPTRALKDPDHGAMSGMGITMEGIEQNPVVYELATDAMWVTEPIDVPNWLQEYAEARYGKSNDSIDKAWSIVLAKIYDGSYLPTEAHFMTRPSASFGAEPSPAVPLLRHAIELLLSAKADLKENHLYQQDLVDLMKRYLEEVQSYYWSLATAAWEAKRSGEFLAASDKYFHALDDLDRLLGTLPEYRLSSWVSEAKKWGKDKSERDQLEENAKLQVTVWGGPILHDYAWKEWSGLVSSFYKERWLRYQHYLMLMDHKSFDAARWEGSIADWELSWTKQHGVPNDSTKADSASLVTALLAQYPLPVIAAGEPGIAIGKPVSVSGGTEPGHDPESAVDGRISGGYWAASPYPQWLKVDLQAVENIDRIQLFTYHDGERYYKYTIQTSTDEKTWTVCVDASNNTEPASSRGATYVFKPVFARYVRVNMLYNSANVGVHISEVKIFRAKMQ